MTATDTAMVPEMGSGGGDESEIRRWYHMARQGTQQSTPGGIAAASAVTDCAWRIYDGTIGLRFFSYSATATTMTEHWLTVEGVVDGGGGMRGGAASGFEALSMLKGGRLEAERGRNRDKKTSNNQPQRGVVCGDGRRFSVAATAAMTTEQRPTAAEAVDGGGNVRGRAAAGVRVFH